MDTIELMCAAALTRLRVSIEANAKWESLQVAKSFKQARDKLLGIRIFIGAGGQGGNTDPLGRTQVTFHSGGGYVVPKGVGSAEVVMQTGGGGGGTGGLGAEGGPAGGWRFHPYIRGGGGGV